MRRLGWGVALTLLAAPLSCGELAVTEPSCEHGSDCVWPQVCCSDPRIPPLGKAVPYCEQITRCDAYLPPMLEGNPCGASALTACAEPWVCCQKTFTCETAEACAAAPTPPPTVPSLALCHGPSDCGPGEYCAGINLAQRDGRCEAFDPLPIPPDQGAP